MAALSDKIKNFFKIGAAALLDDIDNSFDIGEIHNSFKIGKAALSHTIGLSKL